MIHWLWLLPAFLIGGNVGILIMAICECAKREPPEVQPREPYGDN